VPTGTFDIETVQISSCQNYRATNVAPPENNRPLPSLKREPHFSNKYMSKEKKILAKKSQRDLKPRMTVLVRANSNLTNRQCIGGADFVWAFHRTGKACKPIFDSYTE
jgi:hypothetical protein